MTREILLLAFVSASLVLVGCDGKSDPEDTAGGGAPLIDEDSDGYPAEQGGVVVDCDDSDPLVHPDAEEICNGLDDNCDGVPGDDELQDADADGFPACEDCDDVDSDAFPGQVWYADVDLDGFGDSFDFQESCLQPSGYVLDNTDCDDADPDAYPNQLWIPDDDGDGYGDPDGTPLVQCARPDGYTTVFEQDCDDTDPEQFPGQIWHYDGDGDSYGDPLITIEQCERPLYYVTDDTDCDDADPTINPAAKEICDGLDNDCDGSVPGDEIDGDGDGYAVCDGDPDDTDPLVIPEITLEDFEGGVWPGADWVSVDGGGTVDALYAHDGGYGLLDPGWHYMSTPGFGAVGDVLSGWVYFSGSGRAYIGFDADSSGCKSFVVAPNTAQIMMQDNASWGYDEYSYVTVAFSLSQWYYLEIEFLKGTEVEGRLYEADGVTLVDSTSHSYASIDGGTLCMRAFSGVYIDTLTLRY